MAPRMTWILVVLFGAAVTATIAARHPGSAGEARGDTDGNDSPPPEPPRLDQPLVTILHRVGLEPERMAAGGVTAALADDVVAGVETWLALNATTLQQADDRLFTARTNQDRLIRKVRSGLASAQEIVQCQEAVAEFEAADLARKSLLTSAFDAGASALATEVKSALARIKTNGDAWNVPLEFLVLDRAQEEWVLLRAALANERISAKYGEDPDPTDQSLLSTERAKAEVAGARTNLDTRLAEVKTAWEAAAAED